MISQVSGCGAAYWRRWGLLLAGLLGLALCAQGQGDNKLRIAKLLHKEAKRGDVNAQVKLGAAYLTGKYGLKKNPKRALAWLKKAAKPRKVNKKKVRHPRALLYLGICYDSYYQFLKVKQNKQKALDYYLLALEHGLPEANQYIAFTYQELGRPEKAAAYFKQAADMGNQRCQVEYGRILLEGRGVKADPQASIPYLEKAARHGDAEAQLLLADCYSGAYPPIARDNEKMIDHLWAAAVKRPVAATRIGFCYENGLGDLKGGVEVAVKWYQKAIAAGEPQAMLQLAHCYAKGRGVVKDEKKALDLYRRAAAAKPPLAMAYHNLGVCHALGKGTARDDATAFAWFQGAAELKLPAAMFSLGDFYQDGRAVDQHGKPLAKDPKMAFNWYKQAAALGYAPALLEIGYCYYYGRGAAVDKAKARQAFEKAAKLKNPQALRALKTLF